MIANVTLSDIYVKEEFLELVLLKERVSGEEVYAFKKQSQKTIIPKNI
jgi:hypothetical protein